MPSLFVDYVISTLSGATSRVRCKHGLTDTFQLHSSVRQGDPLAALIFIIVMDVLHVGLHDDIGDNAVGRAYGMSGGTPVASLGYADDTVILSSTWEGAVIQHDWVREFFVAHHLRLNPSKSYCIIASGEGVGPPAAAPDGGCRHLPGIPEHQAHDPSMAALPTLMAAVPHVAATPRPVSVEIQALPPRMVASSAGLPAPRSATLVSPSELTSPRTRPS